jgi:hypothetical protein
MAAACGFVVGGLLLILGGHLRFKDEGLSDAGAVLAFLSILSGIVLVGVGCVLGILELAR